jgi:hypothetical protein
MIRKQDSSIRSKRWLTAAGATVVILLTAASCSTGASGGAEGTPVVMRGVMTKGSVILNGVHFVVPGSAAIAVDDSPSPESELRDGMIVSLKGKINDDGTGTLEKLDTEDELQGPVDAVDPAAGTVTVLSQTIYVDDRTIYGNMTDLSDLTAPSDYVEVHGFRDASGAIRATRIEELTGTPEVEIKGVISGYGGSTFDIGALTITHTGAAIIPPGTVLVDGMRVEAKLSGTTATEIEVEDLTDDPELEPDEGAEYELEGYVSGFTAHPGVFQVFDQTVQTFAATEFRQGSPDDLRDDIRIEVEGSISGGVLLADTLKFKRVRVKIEGEVTARTADTVTVFGLTFERTPFTDGTWPGATGRFKIEGYGDDSGSILYADKIDSTGPGDDIFQAPVQAETGAPGYTMTLYGVTVDLATATFADSEEATLTIDQFFSAVTPATANGGTLIKAKGTFAAGTLTADEAELER